MYYNGSLPMWIWQKKYNVRNEIECATQCSMEKNLLAG